MDGMGTMQKSTLNDLFDLWLEIKRGLKENTKTNYVYMYDQYVRDSLGRMKISQLKKSDIKAFYNRLIDSGKLRVNTIDTLQNVIH